MAPASTPLLFDVNVPLARLKTVLPPLVPVPQTGNSTLVLHTVAVHTELPSGLEIIIELALALPIIPPRTPLPAVASRLLGCVLLTATPVQMVLDRVE